MESERQRRVVVVSGLVAVALLIVGLVRVVGGGADDDAGRLATVDLVGPSGATVSSAELVGAPLVVNFWYAACPPCANELYDFATVHAEYGDRVRFVGVNAIDTVEEMEDFAGERGVSYELYQDRLAELQAEMRLTSFPTTLFVDASGNVVERTGVLDEAGLEAAVVRLLGD